MLTDDFGLVLKSFLSLKGGRLSFSEFCFFLSLYHVLDLFDWVLNDGLNCDEVVLGFMDLIMCSVESTF